jgi:adenine-specific DNA-methyltransferase
MDQVPSAYNTATTPPSRWLLEKFQEIFPGAILDGVLDAARLGEALGVDVAGLKDSKERFGLMWAGRQKAIAALQAPGYAALTPDVENSENWDDANNVFIEGDNLEVLKLMQSAYNDTIKLIYIDPPYNTGNDFVYNDDFADPIRRYLEVTGQVDSSGNRLVANTELSGRKHSNWLTMMYPRLYLARNLLSEDGVICISIDDTEVSNLRHICDEIFGEQNYVSTFNWKKRGTGGQVANNAIIDQVEYVLMYARDLSSAKLTGLPNEREGQTKWRTLRKGGGQWQRKFRPNQYFAIFGDEAGKVSLTEFPDSTPIYPLDANGVEGFWENGLATLERRIEEGEIRARLINGKLAVEQLEVAGETTNAGNFIEIASTIGANETKRVYGELVFDNAKPTDFLLNFLHIANLQADDYVLDFFGGSGTFAQAAQRYEVETGRKIRWIVNTLAEQVADRSIAKASGFNSVDEITLRRIKSLDQAFRVFRLKHSSFERSSNDPSDGLLIVEGTQRSDVDDNARTWEVLLQTGVPLDSRLKDFSPFIVVAGDTTALLLTLDELPDVAMLKSRNITVLLAMEDDFAGKDDLRANLYFACKKANIAFKTF